MCDLPSVYRDDSVTARKPKRCCECRGMIQPGESYRRFTGCWDGRWSTYNTCADCGSLRADIGAAIRDFDYYTPFGEMSEAVFESRDNADWVFRYMDTLRQRGSRIEPWMTDFEAELRAAQPPQQTPPLCQTPS